SHAEQVGNTMIKLERVLLKEKPDWVVVVGDVNATLAASVTAKKMHIKVCHIEAGLRSGDLRMPEEINRLVTDRLSDLLLTPDLLSVENLLKEGVDKKRIKFVGNIMIDTLEANREKAAKLSIDQIIKDNQINGQTHLPLISHNPFLPPSPPRSLAQFALITLHRPSNVDKGEIFSPIIDFLIDRVSAEMPVIWPIHPRAKKQVELLGLWDKITNAKNVFLLHPVGYHEMLKLNMGARLLLTDSGGLQEECTILGTPCLTLRWNTERPITLKEHGGVSVLVGNDINTISKEYSIAIQQNRNPVRPELWDGKSADRIVNEIINAGD
ncbi:MAG: UDP-N-acetylglucosamine 2-epimerase (non-hydrolyzing), partial [Bacteroidales bacterium]|nr:UDP-N-acetylglucosamine 2-epimerase (non-hydrolyzing) [Bacteroidales bacterium]